MFWSELSDDDDWAGLGVEKMTDVMEPVVDVVVVVDEVEVEAVVYKGAEVVMVHELVAVTIPLLGPSKIDSNPCVTRPNGGTDETSTDAGSVLSMSMSGSLSVSVKSVVAFLVLSVARFLVLVVVVVLLRSVVLGFVTVVLSLVVREAVALIAAPTPTQSEERAVPGSTPATGKA